MCGDDFPSVYGYSPSPLESQAAQDRGNTNVNDNNNKLMNQRYCFFFLNFGSLSVLPI